jgi:hypothetical protein
MQVVSEAARAGLEALAGGLELYRGDTEAFERTVMIS